MVFAAATALALAPLACKKVEQPAATAPESVSDDHTPKALASDYVPLSAGGATSAPLPPAPTEAPSSARPPPEDTTLRDRVPLSEEQIAAVTNAASHAELDQAKLARDKAKDAKVRKLAAQFASEQTELDKSQSQVFAKLTLKPAACPLSDELVSEAASTLATLKKARGADLDGVYLDAQLRSHEKFLKLLDTELVVNAKSIDLKNFLLSMRDRVQSHLELVQRLESERNPTAPAAAGK